MRVGFGYTKTEFCPWKYDFNKLSLLCIRMRMIHYGFDAGQDHKSALFMTNTRYLLQRSKNRRNVPPQIQSQSLDFLDLIRYYQEQTLIYALAFK